MQEPLHLGRWLRAGALGATIGLAFPGPAVTETGGLRSPEAFRGIPDAAARSVALFEEAGKVLLHPRCVNCHPASDRPLQTAESRPHQPWVRRGPDGHGVAGMRCSACHGAENFEPARVPGNPKWALAPQSMAWEGKSLRDICEQIKDPARNGNHTVAEMVKHMAEDELVGWGWNPGGGREPAPGTQQSFAALVKAWANTGAHCPTR